MADPRFYSVAGPFSVAELARRSGAALGGAGKAELLLRDVASLEAAGPEQVSWLDNRKYLAEFRATAAGAIFVQPALAGQAPPGATLLLTEQPYRGYAIAAQAFYPEPPPEPGIAPGAVVDPAARLGEGTRVEPNAVIGPGVEIGRRCLIGANSVIGAACGAGRRRAHRRQCQRQPCPDRRPRAALSRRPDRPGRLRLRP